MMKFKKFLAAAMTGAMMLGMVTAAAPAASVIAAGENKSKYNIEIDYEGFLAYISSNEPDPYVILEVCKDAAGTKEGTKYTYKDDGEGIRVDLSFLKAAKDSYIRVYGSSEASNALTITPRKINAQLPKISIKYANPGQKEGEEYKAFDVKKGPSLSKNEDLAQYEYHTLYGGSQFSSLEEFTNYQATAEVAGTTIVIRQAAKDVNARTAAKEDDEAPASAEVKVKIPAAPKAPKIAVDYAKGTVKLPKSAELQIIATVTSSAITSSGSAISSGPQEQAAGGALEVKDVVKLFKDDVILKGANITTNALLTNGFTLVVRTKNAKKGYSNPAIVSIKGSAVLKAKEDGHGAESGTSSITWKEDDKKGTAGFTITVNGNFEYDKNGKWTKYKGGFTTDSKITVRVAGDKSKSEFPSQEYPMEMKAAVLEVEPANVHISKTIALEALAGVIRDIKVTLDGKPENSGAWSINDNADLEVVNNKLAFKAGKTACSASSYTLTVTVGGKTKDVILVAE